MRSMRMMKWCCSNTVARRLLILLSTALITRKILKVRKWARHRDSMININHRTNMMSHQTPLILLVLNRIKTTPTSTRMPAPFKAEDTSLRGIKENLFLHIQKEESQLTIPIKDIKVSKAIPSSQMRLLIHAILQQTLRELTWSSSHIMMSQLCLNQFNVMTIFIQLQILKAWPRGSLLNKHHKATKIQQILRIPMSNFNNVEENQLDKNKKFSKSRLNQNCHPTGNKCHTELPRHLWTRA